MISFFRLLWVKNLTDQIDHCRQQRLLTSIFRAPESSKFIIDPLNSFFLSY